MFKTCHAFAKHNQPLSDYEWQCELDKSKGLDIGKTYQNRVSAKEFVNANAEVERQRLTSDVKAAKFVAFLGDGFKDSSVNEQEMFYVRFVQDGVPMEVFCMYWCRKGRP